VVTLPFHIGINDHVRMVWACEPTVAYVQLAVREIVQHKDYRNGMPVVCEIPQSHYDPSAREVRAIAREIAAQKLRLGPIALVVHSRLHFGLGNMLHAYCRMHGVQLAVFYDSEKGLQWAWREAVESQPNCLEAGA